MSAPIYYFQQRLKEHIDAYWVIGPNLPNLAGVTGTMRYVVDDSTGEIQIDSDHIVTEFSHIGGSAWGEQWKITGYLRTFGGRQSAEMKMFTAVAFPIKKENLLVVLGVIQ